MFWLPFQGNEADQSFSQTIFLKNKRQTMKQINIHVQFTGIVTVNVPDHLSDADARLLAGRVALARILATTDNPDAPEDDAFDDYSNQCLAKATAEQDWDQSEILGVGGKWTVEAKP
jgi:hypothetical protein